MLPESLLTQQPVDYSTIYIDMDSFFASIEQYNDPRLRGGYVGVATGNSTASSIISASYNAKRIGLYTGIRVKEALRICPSLQIVYDSNHSLYRSIHRQVMSILQNTICRVGVRGIDEAYLKIPSYSQKKEEAFALAKAIKYELRIKYNEHINCSIGIASNIWLAKMAASSSKPNGLLCVTKDSIQDFYHQLELTDLNGIGGRMAQRLYNININSPSDMYQASWSKLARSFGVNGQKWYLRLRGYEVDEIPIKERKTLGHQVTITGRSMTNLTKITTYCIKISEVLGYRIRKSNLYSRGLSMQLLTSDHQYYYYNLKKLIAFNTNQSIIRYSKMLLKKHKNFDDIMRITITLNDLVSSDQLKLISDQQQTTNLALSSALDALEQRYQSKVLSFASSFFENSFSLNRIGFAADERRKNYDF